MTQVEKLISSLLNEKLGERFDELEKRFQIEESDISNLEVSIDSLRSNFMFIIETLQECDTISKTINRHIEEVHAETSRIKNVENNNKISTPTLKRDKSLDKSLHKDKSSRNINTSGYSTNSTLPKTKTLTNLKNEIKGMTKNKSNLNLNTDSSSKN